MYDFNAPDKITRRHNCRCRETFVSVLNSCLRSCKRACIHPRPWWLRRVPNPPDPCPRFYQRDRSEASRAVARCRRAPDRSAKFLRFRPGRYFVVYVLFWHESKMAGEFTWAYQRLSSSDDKSFLTICRSLAFATSVFSLPESSTRIS